MLFGKTIRPGFYVLELSNRCWRRKKDGKKKHSEYGILHSVTVDKENSDQL